MVGNIRSRSYRDICTFRFDRARSKDEICLELMLFLLISWHGVCFTTSSTPPLIQLVIYYCQYLSCYQRLDLLDHVVNDGHP